MNVQAKECHIVVSRMGSNDLEVREMSNPKSFLSYSGM